VRLLDRLRRREAATDVAVVGSGLPALAVALELARRRRRVTLLGPAGRGEAPAGLGLAALGPSRPYDRVVRALGAAPARGIWAAGRENLDRMRAFVAEAGIDCGLEARGSFLLAADRGEAESLAESEDMLRDDGFSGEFLDHFMLETRFDLSGFAGAYWAAEGAALDAAALARALAEKARSAGVAFVAAPVRSLETDGAGVEVHTSEGDVRAGAGVVATDAVATGLVGAVGRSLVSAASDRLRVALEPGAALPSAARSVDGAVAWTASPPTLVLAATAPAVAEDGARLERLAARLPVRPGGGERWIEASEVASDGLPVVGILPGQPLAVACGFGATAASWAFASAWWIAEALASGRDATPPPLRPRPAPPGPV